LNYALEVKKENIRCHLDIENDIATRRNGLFTFTIRVHNGNIVDYNVTEHVDTGEYFQLAKVVIQELTISHNLDVGDQENTIRDDNV